MIYSLILILTPITLLNSLVQVSWSHSSRNASCFQVSSRKMKALMILGNHENGQHILDLVCLCFLLISVLLSHFHFLFLIFYFLLFRLVFFLIFCVLIFYLWSPIPFICQFSMNKPIASCIGEKKATPAVHVSEDLHVTISPYWSQRAKGFIPYFLISIENMKLILKDITFRRSQESVLHIPGTWVKI